MSSKRWLICFFSLLLLIAAAVAGLNYYADPYGVFGDRFFNWYELNMTNNPAVAKIAYIDMHHDEYDSYIIGSSGTSAFRVEKLNEYTGGRFYSLFSYGAGMEKTYLTSKYVLENYTVKNLVICMGISDGTRFDDYGTTAQTGLHRNITGEAALPFYIKYLFVNPMYAMAKMEYRNIYDEYLPRFFDIFDVKSGEYDDRQQFDIEHINDTASYLEKYTELKEENRLTYNKLMPYIDDCVSRVADIKRLCDEKGVNLTVIFIPSYIWATEQLDLTQVSIFFDKLSQVSNFWDFFLTSASNEPRYFQDYMHFRKSLGDMALARIYGDDSMYIPDDFGTYVTSENVAQHGGALWDRFAELKDEMSALTGAQANVPDDSARFNVLMYHHLDDNESSDYVVSPARFDAHMAALKDAGYTAVSMKQLMDFVDLGIPLPEKPVLITFDDGYSSNIEFALPILQKYDMKAAIFMVGVFVGTDEYRDTGIAFDSYFGWDDARKAAETGTIELGSHTYDMHRVPQFEPDPATVRQGVLRMKGETEAEYIAAFRSDTEAFISIYEKNLGKRPVAYSFPYGKYADLSEVLLVEYGYRLTVTTEPGINEAIKGLPQSLYGLKRHTVSSGMSAEDLLAVLAAAESLS